MSAAARDTVSLMIKYGKQFTILLEQCQGGLLDNPSRLEGTVLELSKEAGLEVVRTVLHRFTPVGATMVLILSQSHMAVHTWPEHRSMILTLFVCQDSFDVERFMHRVADAVACADPELVCTFER
jgi:S-adenosylmethionine decarboxylase